MMEVVERREREIANSQTMMTEGVIDSKQSRVEKF